MKKVILTLGIAGMLFSGYLSAVKFFSKTCAFGESCPYFFGYPACYYGFTLFAIITITATLWNFKLIKERVAENILLITSLLGILFAGYFTARELPTLFGRGFGVYSLGLPMCALGLIFYVAIFILTLISLLMSKYILNQDRQA